MLLIFRLSLPSCSFEADDISRDKPKELSNMKRHSEGTFSNDYSKFLEDRKAQDFVRWLMNNKRSGSVWDLFKLLSKSPSVKRLCLFLIWCLSYSKSRLTLFSSTTKGIMWSYSVRSWSPVSAVKCPIWLMYWHYLFLLVYLTGSQPKVFGLLMIAKSNERSWISW